MSDVSILREVDWSEVKSQYQMRSKISAELRTLMNDGQVRKFAELAIGISDDAGNYSAAEHPRIKASIPTNLNWMGRVFNLAKEFIPLKNASEVPQLIDRANLDYLKISVGSELSCMMNPKVCWVCNVRTIWTHLAWTRGPGEAEELLKAFRIGDSDSEMAYSNWSVGFHPDLGGSLTEVSEEGKKLSLAANVPPGELTFLWADAIASHVYDDYHQKSLMRP